MTMLIVTGTSTGVGKTVVTAAIAALAVAAGCRVAVVKATQTGVGPGQPGDVDEIQRLVGSPITCRELARYPEPLAPATAARRAGLAPVTPAAAAAAVWAVAAAHDVALLEGTGGLLVPLDGAGSTLADIAATLAAPVLVVAAAGLGTLNHTALTVEALRTRGVRSAGIVIGEWPAEPDLAARCNLADLPAVTGLPLLGALPTGASRLSPREFLTVARQELQSGLQTLGWWSLGSGVAGVGGS
ncbi:MAG: ATP-dependent dethiobiotin synthetase BioD [Pseudonocardiales bacterium]|nr:ATP-dependent dethiobiotin synthetase BioD [Pseudonocardiales bacterium]